MFSFSSLDNRTEENHTETIMSNYWNTEVYWVCGSQPEIYSLEFQ